MAEGGITALQFVNNQFAAGTMKATLANLKQVTLSECVVAGDDATARRSRAALTEASRSLDEAITHLGCALDAANQLLTDPAAAPRKDG